MSTLMKRTNGNASMPAASFSGIVDRVFQENLSRFFDEGVPGIHRQFPNFQVPVNLRETDKIYELELVAPGLQKEDFKVNLQDDTLTVSFEKQQGEKEENQAEGWLRREYRQQSFSRSFQLDESIDPSRISARYQNGILYLQLPKKEGAQKISRNIEIG